VLKQRIQTGVVLAAAALAAVLLLPLGGLAVVLAVVVAAALWEWSDLAGLTGVPVRAGYCLLGLAGLLALLPLTAVGGSVAQPSLQIVLGVAAVAWLLAAAAVLTYPATAGSWGSRWSRAVMGWLAVLPTWLALIYLRGLEQGAWLIIFLVALVASADIGAYGFGRAFGRHKLAPQVSPGKSWEGFIGGMGCGLLFTLLVWWLAWSTRVGIGAMAVVAATTLLASVVGDLTESMVKRYRGVKDSGTLLPGHGGVLDRLDSLCAAAPVFALGLLLAAW
jgi:phosphatidate cytidylyltransferase